MKPAKVRETRTPILARAIKSSIVRDEQGMALVITLLTLVMLTFIGIASFFNASTDIKITGNLKGTAQALYAAEAGMVDMMDSLTTNAVYDPPKPYTTAWAPVDLVASVNGFEYTVQVRHKVDTDDCDGDSVTNEVVMYDQACYPKALRIAGDAGAFAVKKITVTATNGRYLSKLSSEVTAEQFDVKITAALTAQSDILLKGNITVDGKPHPIQGKPDFTDCGGPIPSVSTTAGSTVTEQGSPDLDPPWDNTKTDADQPDTPCEALGLPADCETTTLSAYAVSAAYAAANPMYKEIHWVQGDYATSCLEGKGLLIVHTPGFLPKKCNTASPDYDAAYCAAHPPARLGNVTGNCDFYGLIIADYINKIAGQTTIKGAVISLTEFVESGVGEGSGTPAIFYSCEAMDTFIPSGKFDHKLAWERL